MEDRDFQAGSFERLDDGLLPYSARRETLRLAASLGSMMDLQTLCWLGRPPRLGWAAVDGSDYQTCCFCERPAFAARPA